MGSALECCTPLTNTDSPFPSSYQIPGIMSALWRLLSSYVQLPLLCLENTVFWKLSTTFSCYNFSVPSSRRSLSLGGSDIYIITNIYIRHINSVIFWINIVEYCFFLQLVELFPNHNHNINHRHFCTRLKMRKLITQMCAICP